MIYKYRDSGSWAMTLLTVQRLVQKEFKNYVVYITPLGGMNEISRLDLVDDNNHNDLVASMTIPEDKRTINVYEIIKTIKGMLAT